MLAEAVTEGKRKDRYSVQGSSCPGFHVERGIEIPYGLKRHALNQNYATP